MGAISELSTAGGVVRRNPILFVAYLVPFLFGVIIFGGLYALSGTVLIIYVAWLLFLPFYPFFTGGLVGMVVEGLDGSTSMGTFIEEGKENYLSLLGGGLLTGVFVIGASLAVGFIFLMVVSFLLFVLGVSFSGATQEMAAGIGVFALIILLLVYILLVVTGYMIQLFPHFYPVAIVMDDEGAVDGFTQSLKFVKNNLLSSVGYFFLVNIFSGIIVIPIIIAYFDIILTVVGRGMANPTLASFPIGKLIIYGVIVLLFQMLIGTYLTAYKIAFYDDLREEETSEDSEMARRQGPQPSERSTVPDR